MKILLRTSMLMMLVIPLIGPLVVNGQEVVSAVYTSGQEDRDTKDRERDAKDRESDEVEAKNAKSGITYAKNVGYGCGESADCDEGVAVIDASEMLVDMSSFDYKINAYTHEVTVQMGFVEDMVTNELALNVIEGSNTSTTTIDGTTNTGGSFVTVGTNPDASGNYNYEFRSGPLDDHGFAKLGEYSITITQGGSSSQIPTTDGTTFQSAINIEVPKIINSGGDTYSLLGDSVNNDTDADDVIDSEVISPSTTIPINEYGIYELESIGYEEVNDTETNWDVNDLTISKYDHVIRPIDGNYLVLNGTDASSHSISATATNTNSSIPPGIPICFS